MVWGLSLVGFIARNGERSLVVLGDCIIPFLFQRQHYELDLRTWVFLLIHIEFATAGITGIQNERKSISTMYITAFRCTIDAIQKALLGVMSKTEHSNGCQRMLSLDPRCEELSLSNLQSLLSRKEDVSPNSYTAFFYRPLNAPDFVCMRTPLEDGWQTLFNVLSLELAVESYRMHFQNRSAKKSICFP